MPLLWSFYHSDPPAPVDQGECGKDFVPTCNADGTTRSCIDGQVVIADATSGYCHVFAEAQLAQYILEASCTVIELPRESCIDVGGFAGYTKQVCGKAEDGKYYWYLADAAQCANVGMTAWGAGLRR